MAVRTIRPVFITDKNVLYHLFWLVPSSRRLNLGKYFRIIHPKRWHPSDSSNHYFCMFFGELALSAFSTSNRYAIQKSICSTG